MKTNNYKEHTLQSFLETYHVVIPKVQRDYAQGRQTDDVCRVRDRFLEAIKKHLTTADPAERVMKMDFVYGEKEILSYFDNNDIKQERMVVTPLDGQQRLTTLYLLHWYAAKREGIDRSKYRFLKNFTYDVRPSSVAFCKHLLDYQPDMSRPISNQLKDEFWFMGEWNQDPTVLGMLVMLDDIQTRFKDIPDLWHLLTDTNERRIVFYFLPLSDNGLSDELYVKMNARGKKLTSFEHFKAEYEKLYAADSDKRTSVCHRMDVEWIDVLFPYRGQDDTTDSEFMRYFFYISHILCYQQGLELRDNPFDLIDLLYADKVTNAQDNRQFLEQAIDCWHDVMCDYGSIDAFFQKYFSCNDYEQGKVCTYKNNSEYDVRGTCIQNFFSGCIKLYLVNNSFSLGDFLFLYGILVYLIHRDSIEEKQFVGRIRILRNLIWNSDSGEIRRDYMKDLLNEVSTLMLTGEITMEGNNSESVRRFNKDQEREEKEKIVRRLTMKDEDWNIICRLEDHYLLYGRVAWLGYNNLHLADTFYHLFARNDFGQIHKALISINDYTQYNGNRYYMCNHNGATWKQWLHRNDKQSMEVLILLLEKVYAGQSLEDMVQAFLQEQDRSKTYSWRYYFAKYDQMQRGADGEYIWGNNDYKCTALNRHQLNGQHWDPYLNVIYQNSKDENGESVFSLENYGSDLQLPQQSVSLRISETGEYVLIREQEEENVPIPQNPDGTDQVDRIEFISERLIKEFGLQR